MRRSQNISNSFFSLVLVIFSVYSYLFLSVLLNSLISGIDSVSRNKNLYFLLSAMGSMALYTLLFFFLKHFNRDVENESKVQVPPNFYLLLIGEAVLLQHLVTQFFYFFYDHFLPSKVELEFANLIETHPWYVILLALFVAPVFEELVFRKQVLGILSKNFNSYTAIVLSALIFGAFHLTLRQFLYTTLLGLLFGKIYLATGSIAATIVMHFAFNAFGLLAEDFMMLLFYALGPKMYLLSLPIFFIAGLFGVIIILKQLKKMSLTQGEATLDKESEDKV